LISVGPFRRNVVFSGIVPNLIVQGTGGNLDAAVAEVTVLEPPAYWEEDAYESRFFQPAIGEGALEVALPWAKMSSTSGFLKLLAFVTGGIGTGTGDAAPDPTALLSALRQAQAHLNNAITIPYDDNHDGLPDTNPGVSPRSVASFEFTQQEPVRDNREIDLQLERNSFSPDASESLRFQISVQCSNDPVQLYVSGDVYSVSGEKVRTLFSDELRTFTPGVPPQWDEWDGRDDSGEIVRGGIYVVNVGSSVSPGAASSSARKSAAVIR
jgi:hypothetical protein